MSWQDSGVKLKRPESSGDAIVLQPHFMVSWRVAPGSGKFDGRERTSVGMVGWL